MSMYLVLESILFVLTEGCSWRAIDRPQARWNSVYQYFRRWCHRGTLEKVLTQFGPELAAGWHFIDSTHVKVHADGSNPAGGQASQAMGRTKGSTPRFMLSSMHARNLLSSPCPAGTKPTFPWRQSSRTASYKILLLLATKPMIAPPSGRLRLPRALKPAFLVARTEPRLSHSPQSFTGVVIG